MQIREYIFSTTTLNVTKGTLAFLLSHIFLWIPEFQPLFATTSLGLYLYICLIAAAGNAGVTVGRMSDGLVLLLTGIGIAAVGSLVITGIGSSSVIGLWALGFCFFYYFCFVRTLGPRWMGFSLLGCLVIAFAIISNVNAGQPSFPTPVLWYTIYAMLIGTAIGFTVTVFIIPTFAHKELKLFLADWIHDLATYVELSLSYVTSVDPRDADEIAKLRQLLVAKIGLVDIHLNDVASEFNYSFLPYPVLSELANKMKKLTVESLYMSASILEHKTWLDASPDRKVPNSEEFKMKRNAIIKSTKSLLTDIQIRLAKGNVQHLMKKAKITESDTITIDSKPLQEKVIENVLQFELLLRTHLDQLYKTESSKNDEDSDTESWTDQTEEILTVYHVALTTEKAIKSIIDIHNCLLKYSIKKSFYAPIMKWIPIQHTKNVLNALDLRKYKRKCGHFSPYVLCSSLFQSLIDNMWTLKSALALSLFLIIFLDPNSRPFWQTWGLSGSLITIVIILSPYLGASYMGAIFQLVGSIAGNSFALGTFYLVGPNPYLLWISVLLIGFPSYYLLIKMPQYTSISLLLLISYSATSISCWNQKFAPLPGLPVLQYWEIWGKSIVSLCIGVGFGVAFNLFVFPKFASHELPKKIAGLLISLESLYMKAATTSSDYTRDVKTEGPERALFKAKQTIEHLSKEVEVVQAQMFQVRGLIGLATIEPELEVVFSSKKYMLVLDKMQKILNCIRGCQLTLKAPWYASESISELWVNMGDQRAELVKTIQVLFRLYESSILLKRTLPSPLPSAIRARSALSYNILSVHLSKTLSKTVHDTIEHESTIVDNIIDERWELVRKSLDEQQENQEPGRVFGVGTVNDIYYYSFVAWMKYLAKNLDELADIINSLYEDEK
ncbi:hypothetical protein HDV02_003086 [Globomyces sp. JEL0801]|nr:hypothetical protein HDV02_003086 [Globomyces sp. JEL0801]